MAFLELANISKTFGTYQAVRDLSLEVAQGELLTLLGPSGCGKTTTLRMVAGLEEPDSGDVVLDGQRLFSASSGVFVDPEDRRIGMVFQSYAVWPHMSVFENVAYPLQVKGRPLREIRERVDGVLDLVGLLPFRNRSAALLSGGEQQRVALARAIVFNPIVVLFDEPLSNLDAQLRERMRVELRRLVKQLGITAVYVTHDQAEAMVLSDRIAVMNQGSVEQVGDPKTIYNRPATRFVAEFLGAANFVEATVVDTSAWPIVQAVTGRSLGDMAVRLRVERPVAVGARLLLAVRPHRLRFATPGEPARNALRGRVVEVYYLGDRLDCRVQVGEKLLRVHAAESSTVSVGTEVELLLAPDSFVVVEVS